MIAFRLRNYVWLLASLARAGYSFAPVRELFTDPAAPTIYLRHDVDRLVWRAVRMARAEHTAGIRSTYYFRCSAPGEFPEEAIRNVAELGHEIGLHYETVVQARGDLNSAKELFLSQLARLRQFGDVATVAAHGSPLSKWENGSIVDPSFLRTAQLLGDAALVPDGIPALYITDTGGNFGSALNRRDHTNAPQWDTPSNCSDLAANLRPSEKPYVILNCHPERWPASVPGMIQSALFDRMVNIAKRLVQPGRFMSTRRL